MKILFVSTVPVFPPTDGVRIPPSHYISGLSKEHDVDFLLLEDGISRDGWNNDCEATAAQVQDFWTMRIRRQPKLVGVARELLGLSPYYGAWNTEGPLPSGAAEKAYDAVVACTPVAICICARPEFRKSLTGRPRWIAAMSDLYSLVMAKLAKSASKSHRWTARLLYLIKFGMRSRIVAVTEMRVLANYDRVFVQTEKEREWVSQKKQGILADKTVCLTNAAADELFELPLERARKSLVFVGSLSTLYGERFHWFVHNVWKPAKEKNRELTLTAIGRDASDLLVRDMEANDVRYVQYVEDLTDIYRDHDILVAPIFKGYGLINKVVEAMSAGCVVVGDETAFNGIQGFVADKHGIVANDEREFIDALVNGLSDEEQLNSIRRAAHELMQKQFRWSQRIDTLEHALAGDS